MPLPADTLRDLIASVIPVAVVEIHDIAGDNDHYRVVVTAAVFAGQSRIDQHRMVQAAVKDVDIHALSIETRAI